MAAPHHFPEGRAFTASIACAARPLEGHPDSDQGTSCDGSPGCWFQGRIRVGLRRVLRTGRRVAGRIGTAVRRRGGGRSSIRQRQHLGGGWDSLPIPLRRERDGTLRRPARRTTVPRRVTQRIAPVSRRPTAPARLVPQLGADGTGWIADAAASATAGQDQRRTPGNRTADAGHRILPPRQSVHRKNRRSASIHDGWNQNGRFTPPASPWPSCGVCAEGGHRSSTACKIYSYRLPQAARGNAQAKPADFGGPSRRDPV